MRRTALILCSAFIVVSAQVFFVLEPHFDSSGFMGATLALVWMLIGAIGFGFLVTKRQEAHTVLHPPTKHRAQLTSALIKTNIRTILLFCVSLVCWSLALLAHTASNNYLAVVLWVLSLVALISGGWSRSHMPELLSTLRRHWPYALSLLALVMFTLISRSIALSTVPWDFDGDYASHGLEARKLMQNVPDSLFSLGWAGIPMLGFLPSAVSMSVLGDSLQGLYAAAVVEGTLLVLATFLLTSLLFSQRIALIASGLMSLSYVHIAASRTAEYIDPVLFVVLTMAFVVLGLQTYRRFFFVLSGITSAVCLSMYFSGRISFLLLALIAFYLGVTQKQAIMRWWQQLLGWTVGLLIGLGPYLLVYLSDHNLFLSRTRQVFLFHPPVTAHMFDTYQVDSYVALIANQLQRAILLFHYVPDSSTQFGLLKPFLDPLLGILFALGLGIALVRWRNFSNFLLLGWIGLIVLSGVILTSNPPFWPRILALLPPVVILAALPLDAFIAVLQRWSSARRQPWLSQIGTSLVIILLVVTAFFNWSTYLQAKSRGGTTRTYIARFLADTETESVIWLVSDPFDYQDREFEFLAPGRLAGNISREQIEALQLPFSSDRSLEFILTDNHQDLLPLLKERYPNGVLVEHLRHDSNKVAFSVYRVVL